MTIYDNTVLVIALLSGFAVVAQGHGEAGHGAGQETVWKLATSADILL